MLTLDEQRVRLFVLFGANPNSDVLLLDYDGRNRTSVRHIYIYMQPHSNGDDSRRLRVDIGFGGIYDTLLC